METVEKLRNRIGTAEELQSVVKTMKGLSAVSIRSYERAAEAVHLYSAAVNLGLQVLLSQNRELQPDARNRKALGTGVIVFGSEQGLCGPFNRNICEHALDALRGKSIGLEQCRVAAAGTRLGDELTKHVSTPVETFPMPASVDGITDRVTDILVRVTSWVEDEGLSRVLLFHHRPVSGATFEPAEVSLFPFDEEWIADLRTRKWETNCLPTYFSAPTTLFRTLIRSYLFIELYQAFAASLASEHAARLAAMQAAENNIEERLTRLSLELHQVRQASITEELLDVVSGFEAMRDKLE